MAQVSKNKLSKKVEKELIQQLILVLSAINKSDEMTAFVSALLTETEKVMLAKRLAIVLLLSEGYNDSEIANFLHVTRITVAKTRYYLDVRGKKGYEIALAKIVNDKQLNASKKLLFSLARYAIRASGGRVKPTVLD